MCAKLVLAVLHSDTSLLWLVSLPLHRSDIRLSGRGNLRRWCWRLVRPLRTFASAMRKFSTSETSGILGGGLIEISISISVSAGLLKRPLLLHNWRDAVLAVGAVPVRLVHLARRTWLRLVDGNLRIGFSVLRENIRYVFSSSPCLDFWGTRPSGLSRVLSDFRFSPVLATRNVDSSLLPRLPVEGPFVRQNRGQRVVAPVS